MQTHTSPKAGPGKTSDNPLLYDIPSPREDLLGEGSLQPVPRGGNSRGGPGNVILFADRPEQEELDSQALQLRSLGFTYRQIARHLGIHLNTAYQRVQRAAQRERCEFPEQKHDIRDFELMKLKRLEQAVMATALEGDLAAVKIVLRIMTMRQTLLKIEGPARDEGRGVRGEGNDEARRQNAEQVSDPKSEPEASSEPEALARDAQSKPEGSARDAGKRQNPEVSRQDHRIDKMESSGGDPVNPVDPVQNPSNAGANSANKGANSANAGANTEKSENPRNPAKPGTPKDPQSANAFSSSANARKKHRRATGSARKKYHR